MKKHPFPATVAWAVTALFLSFSAARMSGADWPQYRGGPVLRGVAAGKLADKLALLWSFKTGGPVKSSAAIVGGNVFVGSDDGFLYSLALATGKTNWAFKTGGNVESILAMTTSACFAIGQGGFRYADLDTPLFLAANPFAGGYRLDGGRISVAHIASGHGVTPAAAAPA